MNSKCNCHVQRFLVQATTNGKAKLQIFGKIFMLCLEFRESLLLFFYHRRFGKTGQFNHLVHNVAFLEGVNGVNRLATKG